MTEVTGRLWRNGVADVEAFGFDAISDCPAPRLAVTTVSTVVNGRGARA